MFAKLYMFSSSDFLFWRNASLENTKIIHSWQMYNRASPLKKCGWCANVSDVNRVGGVPSWVRVSNLFCVGQNFVGMSQNVLEQVKYFLPWLKNILYFGVDQIFLVWVKMFWRRSNSFWPRSKFFRCRWKLSNKQVQSRSDFL